MNVNLKSPSLVQPNANKHAKKNIAFKDVVVAIPRNDFWTREDFDALGVKRPPNYERRSTGTLNEEIKNSGENRNTYFARGNVNGESYNFIQITGLPKEKAKGKTDEKALVNYINTNEVLQNSPVWHAWNIRSIQKKRRRKRSIY